VDHGIESPSERINAGKTAHGTVKLDAYHQGNQIIIEVTDDGRGIDQDKLIAKAVKTGIIKQSEVAALTEPDVLDLVFHPGFEHGQNKSHLSPAAEWEWTWSGRSWAV